MFYDQLIQRFLQFIRSLDIRSVTGAAIAIVIFGLILLSFTFILPILVFAAAIAIIVFLIYIVYRFLGGR